MLCNFDSRAVQLRPGPSGSGVEAEAAWFRASMSLWLRAWGWYLPPGSAPRAAPVERCGAHVASPLPSYDPLTAHTQVEAFKQSKQSEFELLEASLDAAEAAVRAERVKNIYGSLL